MLNIQMFCIIASHCLLRLRIVNAKYNLHRGVLHNVSPTLLCEFNHIGKCIINYMHLNTAQNGICICIYLFVNVSICIFDMQSFDIL